MKMSAFNAIAAMSENRVIGDHGKIPWHLPEDFRWFKHKTMGGTLVMGRKTFESIGKPLPGRKTVVLTHRSQVIPNVDESCSLRFFLTDYVKAHTGENFWVCGGGEIYRQLLDHCRYLYLTIVKRQVEGDTFFPPAWHVEKTHLLDQVIHENEEFRVERWKNKIYPFPPDWMLPPETWPFPNPLSS